MWANKTAIAGPCIIERSISEKSWEKWALKGLKQKMSLAASWIGVKLHWIWAIQSESMKSAGTVLIGSVQAKVRVLR